jgi:glycosyltransferase involved in cell wall biosynthesis
MARELELGTGAQFLGLRKDAPSLVAGADVALLTSDNEGTPVALIEASAGAKPSVATSVGGVPDIVTAETGRLAAAGDVDGIASGLAELATDPERRRRLGAAARERVRATYSATRLVDDIDRLYQDLLRSRTA